MYPCWDLSESFAESLNFTFLVACVFSPFETWTGFGVSLSETSLQYGLALCSL